MYCFSSRFSMTARTLPRCFSQTNQARTTHAVKCCSLPGTALPKRRPFKKQVFVEGNFHRTQEGAERRSCKGTAKRCATTKRRRSRSRRRRSRREAGGKIRRFKRGGVISRFDKEKEPQRLGISCMWAGSKGPGDDDPPAAEALIVAGRQKNIGQGTVCIASTVIMTVFDVAGPKHESRLL